MARNRYTREVQTSLLQKRVESLSKELQKALKEGSDSDIDTLEGVLSESFRYFSRYFKQLDTSLLNGSPEVTAGLSPNLSLYNENFSDISGDLETVFAELENLEDLLLSNFNYLVSESNQLSRKAKSIFSDLGDFVLYSKNLVKDALYVSDNFSNLEKVDFQSDLLNERQAFLSQSEGIITLPIQENEDSRITPQKKPVIGSISNGVVGNNFEPNRGRNDNLDLIFDNNPDTWFEYERVVSITEDDKRPLILELTINLGSEAIINHIRINPNNFGAETSIDIEEINTSRDGNEFISIKDDIPTRDVEVIDEQNNFTLAPSTSKFAGQGLYTFKPRRAKYIHVVLIQHKPYVIEPRANQRLARYAIGIRDILIHGFRYRSKGQLISSEFSVSDEVKKVSLETTQLPSQLSSLAKIRHELSPDNGNTWHELNPIGFTPESGEFSEVPEILDFNTGKPGAIRTEEPVTSLRYRASLERDPEAFSADNPENVNTVFRTELHQVPDTSPFEVTLNHKPIQDSIVVIDPHFGSRGYPQQSYIIGRGDGYKKEFQLPWKNIQLDKSKSASGDDYIIEEESPLKVTINNEEWTRGDLSSAGSTDKVYELNLESGTLKFGDGSNGRVVTKDSNILLYFTPERLFTEKTNRGYLAQLNFPTNGDKDTIEIKRFDTKQSASEVAPQSVKRFRLSQENIEDGSVQLSDSSVFNNEEDFVNGSDELSTSGEYSIDYDNGVIYSFDPTDSSSTTTVSYNYKPEVILGANDWRFDDEEKNLKSRVLIDEPLLVTQEKTDHAVPSGVQKFSVEHFNLEPGTLEFSVPSGVTDVFEEEVEFVDGRTEVLGLIQAIEDIPDLISGLNSFDLKITPEDTPRFSNSSVFNTDVSPSTPSSDGEYSISGATIEVYLDSDNQETGEVAYSYSDPTQDTTGRYSVDYHNGSIYTASATPGNITLNYQYSKFEISYPIARVVPRRDYEVDVKANKITLSDREILKNIYIAGDGLTKFNESYQILYLSPSRGQSEIAELEPYFTPILKEYNLKILTKSKLF